MKLKRISAALFIMALISCKSKTAFDYSQAIVKMENDLSADLAKADVKVAEYMDAKMTDSAIVMTKQMEALAENTLKEIKDLEAPKVKEGDNFKKEAIRYFSYIKSIYTSFHRLTMASSDEKKEIERQRLARIIKDKNEATDAMQEAQRKFAAANDFRIENAPKKSE